MATPRLNQFSKLAGRKVHQRFAMRHRRQQVAIGEGRGGYRFHGRQRFRIQLQQGLGIFPGLRKSFFSRQTDVRLESASSDFGFFSSTFW